MPPRAVFDTNILISALLTPRGQPFQCVELAREGLVVSITCAEILDEFRKKLTQKFGLPTSLVSTTIGQLTSISELVTLPTVRDAASRTRTTTSSSPARWQVRQRTL